MTSSVIGFLFTASLRKEKSRDCLRLGPFVSVLVKFRRRHPYWRIDGSRKRKHWFMMRMPPLSLSLPVDFFHFGNFLTRIIIFGFCSLSAWDLKPEVKRQTRCWSCSGIHLFWKCLKRNFAFDVFGIFGADWNSLVEMLRSRLKCFHVVVFSCVCLLYIRNGINRWGKKIDFVTKVFRCWLNFWKVVDTILQLLFSFLLVKAFAGRFTI